MDRESEIDFEEYLAAGEAKAKLAELYTSRHKFCFTHSADFDGIFSGENFKEVIVDAIETAKVVIFVSSVNSNASRYVIREIGCAVQRNKTIIPLMLDNSPYAKSIAYDIGDIDQIDYTEPKSANNKLIASLAYALGK